MTRRSQLSGAIAVLGGAGFIGSNLAHSYLAEGREVIVIDNLSRPGVARNLDWLRRAGAGQLTFVHADIAEGNELADALGAATAVFHFAAQTAVTTSLDAPIPDFRTNALGTLNVLETIRRSGRRIPLIYSSTNKVYGGLDDLELVAGSDRYEPSARTVRDFGISEDQPLHFSTPYGCSKGVADQYVLDYASSYDLPTAVLRMSCIYGPRQFGTEDQGWVAHFLIRTLQGQPISVYGDGRQVRDILFVDDAVAAYRRLLEEIETFRGTAFNLGGGPRNAVSLRQVLDEIATISATELQLEFGPWRTRDQLYFVADTRRIEQALDWRAEVDWKIGLRRLWQWLSVTQNQQPAREARRVVA